MITVALSADGRLDLYNLAGEVHLVADVAGYLVPPAPPAIPPQTLEVVGYGAVGGVGASSFGCMTLDAGPSGIASLGLPLPAGAVITAVHARYRDSSPTAEIRFELHHVTGFVGGAPAADAVVSATFTSSGTTNGEIAFLNLNANLAPVSDSSMYYLRASLSASASTLQFCGASVDYTLG